MSLLFLDSSALAKRYLMEVGTTWVRSLTDPSAGNTIILAEITRVEVAAALAARQRARTISLEERDAAFKLVILHYTTEYQMIPANTSIIDRAMVLTQHYRLRGYDAVQLATALIVNDQYIAAGFTNLTCITADDDLIGAAHAEGLPTDNPNMYP